ncbi:MAG: nucleotidyltransferase domain-containing protein [Defluviitaleaceae bacterium]|nr:nucleotidyltransferase domain-containing protein [Defluviitaleaceae bacterium]
MNQWKNKLDTFLKDFEHMVDATGILVCGSYVTGSPTKHSDLDVHIILKEDADYRERGNKIVHGLMIEYFANPPKQILAYFDEDLREKSLMSQTQFATGEILRDDCGTVQTLKNKALAMIEDFYANIKSATMLGMTKYFLWDMLDDLHDAFETNRTDFDFLYYNFLNKIITSYMNYENMPYNFKTILGNIKDEIVKKKYLMRELPDGDIADLIAKCITASEKADKLRLYQNLTDAILNKHGGFCANGYKLKSTLDI